MAKHMRELAVAWSMPEEKLEELTEFKGGKLIVENAEHLAFLIENGGLSQLVKLDVSNSKLGPEAGKALASAIAGSGSLTEVCCLLHRGRGVRFELR